MWPENWPAIALFLRVSSQWLTGMNGPTGLNYPSVYPLLDRAAKTPEEWDWLFDDVQQIERAALSEMQKK